MNIPTTLTALRIFLVPVLVVVFYLPFAWVPIACAVTLVLLLHRDPALWLAIPAAIIISREIVVSALRELMAELGQRTTVAVAALGKIKTISQMVALSLMLYRHDLGPVPMYWLGTVLLYVATVLTIWSMLIYLRVAWPTMMAKGSDGGRST